MQIKTLEPKIELLPPKKITTKNVVYWSTTYKGLVDELGKPKANVMKAKAIKFIENNCLNYNPEDKLFSCSPLKGYNKTTYTMEAKKMSCNCQGYITKAKRGDYAFCSHLLALKFAFKMNYFRSNNEV